MVGGDIDRRVGTAASFMLRVDLNDRPEGNDGHENMCDGRSQNDLRSVHVHAKAKNKAKKKKKKKKTTTCRKMS